MQINVHFKLAEFVLLYHGLLRLVDCWLLVRAWIYVEPIEVVVMRIQTVVASRHSVWIEQRNDFENIPIKQYSCLLSFWQQEIDDAVEHIWALNLSWMHSRWKKYSRLIKYITPLIIEHIRLLRSIFIFRKEAWAFQILFPLLCTIIAAGQCYELHVALLFGIAQELPMEVDIRILCNFLCDIVEVF